MRYQKSYIFTSQPEQEFDPKIDEDLPESGLQEAEAPPSKDTTPATA